MSVLIKGMEIPTSCDTCRLMMLTDTNCAPELFCGCPIVFKAHPPGMDNRPDYCPLVPVPEHGRLIDKDALLEDIDNNWIVTPDGEGNLVEVHGVEKVLAHIAYAPTIIPADKEVDK